jgi:hypothetical protein
MGETVFDGEAENVFGFTVTNASKPMELRI